jgi:hypothetical protein
MVNALTNLTRTSTSDSAQAEMIASALPDTLGACNELTFESFAETVAYSIWHLADRYGRVLQVLDHLTTSGELPLRRTRLTALEVGAGPMPALHAIRDFYADIEEWARSIDPTSDIVPATHLFPLDRGNAWPRLIHTYSEELIRLGDRVGPHVFDVSFRDFAHFSVKNEHLSSIARLAQWLVADADEWGEYLPLGSARSLASASQISPPSGIDIIVVCNFLTERTMTERFADELSLLSRSLSPGGVLILIGSASASYEQIFDDFCALVELSPGTRRLDMPEHFEAHTDLRMHEMVRGQIADSLLQVETSAPIAFDSVRSDLPADVQYPLERDISFPRFKVAAYRNEPHLRRRN